MAEWNGWTDSERMKAYDALARRLEEAERLLRYGQTHLMAGDQSEWKRDVRAFLAGAPADVPGKGQPGNVPSEGRADDRSAAPVPYGCHVDIESMPDDWVPDACVRGTDREDDCVYAIKLAREGKPREACQYWQPIKPRAPSNGTEGGEMKPIPIAAAKRVAEAYGYDQVVIVARKVGGGEHCTTYGVDKANGDVAARIGDFFKYELMKWPRPSDSASAPPPAPPES